MPWKEMKNGNHQGFIKPQPIWLVSCSFQSPLSSMYMEDSPWTATRSINPHLCLTLISYKIIAFSMDSTKEDTINIHHLATLALQGNSLHFLGERKGLTDAYIFLMRAVSAHGHGGSYCIYCHRQSKTGMLFSMNDYSR